MRTYTFAVAALGMSLLASIVHAGYTPVKTNLDETNAADIFTSLYGGSFTQTGVDFTNGSVTAQRVDDGHDQLWTGDFRATILGRFSGYSQEFGVAAGKQFQELMSAQGIGFNNTPHSTEISVFNEPFLRSGDSGTQSSLVSGNKDGRDHLITYQVHSNDSRSWLLFWEDLNDSPTITKGRSASDFNDLVVLLRAADDSNTPPAPAVPLPPAAYVGVVTMGLGLWAARKRIGL
jgi:hypothetical protein